MLTGKTGGVYQEFTNSFTRAYTEKGNSEYPVVIKSLSIDDPSLSNNSWNTKNTLIVTVGTKAATHAVSMKTVVPLIHAMLPYSTYQKIVGKHEDCSTQTAIYLDQPIRRQLNLSDVIFPKRKTYGFLLGDVSSKRYEQEKKSQSFLNEVTEELTIQESDELAWSLRSLSEKVDVFIAINDPLIFNPNNAKWFLYMAYQEKRPVIGFSLQYVSAGASASVYSTPSQLAEQTAEMIIAQENKGMCLFEPQYPRYFNVAVNNAVIQSLSGKTLTENYLHERLLLIEGELK